MFFFILLYLGRRSRAVSSVQSNVVGEGAIIDMVGSEREIKSITLPTPLRKILTDDHNMINVNHMLPKIPARVTVEQIVQQVWHVVVVCLNAFTFY